MKLNGKSVLSSTLANMSSKDCVQDDPTGRIVIRCRTSAGTPAVIGAVAELGEQGSELLTARLAPIVSGETFFRIANNLKSVEA